MEGCMKELNFKKLCDNHDIARWESAKLEQLDAVITKLLEHNTITHQKRSDETGGNIFSHRIITLPQLSQVRGLRAISVMEHETLTGRDSPSYKHMFTNVTCKTSTAHARYFFLFLAERTIYMRTLAVVSTYHFPRSLESVAYLNI